MNAFERFARAQSTQALDFAPHIVVVLFLSIVAIPAAASALPAGLTESEAAQIERSLKELTTTLTATRSRLQSDNIPAHLDLPADADLFSKGVTWALRYETKLEPGDIALIKHALERGRQRAAAVEAGHATWTSRKGKILRGYISAVDGSTQPYGVIVPQNYDPSKPIRLDVVLHGSTRPVGLSELRFGSSFDEGDDEQKSAAAADFIELHPLGRVENCYRWAGETDVFEAIESVCRNYKVDRDRIVLRGMSMGASGTWHLGLKHPDFFVALGPYCGYVDTHRFSETPMGNFVRVGPLPEHQEKVLHMLDSVDYAANAGVVPAIAAIGDKDPFFQAHVIMGEAMKSEGLEMVNLISPGTGHVIDPKTHAEQMRRIGEYAAKGRDHAPPKIRFVTWTLKYNKCHWIELLALGSHYDRAEIEAVAAKDGSIEIARAPRNITRFVIHPPMLRDPSSTMRINGVDIPLPDRAAESAAQPLVFALEGGQWRCLGLRQDVPLTGKRPGMQGPIDDGFTAPFLCVRGTGKPWNPNVGAWTDSGLRRFGYEYARYLRGDVPVKNDTDITEADIRTRNLILFGDPGSNSIIRKVLPNLAIGWSQEEVRLGDQRYSAKDHAPVLICPNPLPGAGDHYVVLNSGHTFHEKEFAAVNYLLFPRLGDWAIMRIGEGAEKWQPTSPSFPEEPVKAGFFDEQWKLPASR